MNKIYKLNFFKKKPLFWLIQLIYFVLCFVIIYKLPADLPYVVGADASSWLQPAKALLKYYDFVLYDFPNIVDIYRPPLVPIFNALFLWIGQDHGIKTIIFAQIVLLSLTSIFLGRILETIKKGTGIAAMTILLFNPNSLSSAFLIQSETLFCCLLFFSSYYLLRYINSEYWNHILTCGLFLALATLARPTTQYLIVLLPLIALTLLILKYGWSHFKLRVFIQGAAASLLATMIISPWALKVGQIEGQPSLTTAEIRSIYIFDQLLYFEAYRSDTSINETNKQLSTSESRQLLSECQAMPQNSSNRVACFNKIIIMDSSQILKYPTREYIRPFLKSMAGFLLSGGSGNWHNLLLKNNQQSIYESWLNVKQSEPSALLQILSKFNLVAICITIFCLVYSGIIKLFSLFGIYFMIKRKDFSTLSVIVGIIVYFAVTTLFLGQSRYRVPIEPYFAILSVLGWIYFWGIIAKKHRMDIS